ncbi:MAG: hypothetical protein L6Q37_05495 [Bdellovibrionaceae bacterium]|nr:hypothetical protein [Pseudobdellovibrionaceae bacterium]NUM58115.1 hypothetical protein [Pseudobdellovibrionaceae bacterium]
MIQKRRSWKKIALIFNLILYSSLDVWAQKDVLFEGFFKVLINKQHIGYSITRYEYDPKSKNFYCTVFTRTGALGGNIIESLKAVSDANLVPLNYEYTTLITDNQKSTSKKIEAKFIVPTKNKKNSKKIKMIASVFQDGKLTKIENDLPNDEVFLSYFLVYKMLKSKVGIQTESRYTYDSIAEEKAAVIKKSVATVTGVEDVNGVKAYRVENKFDENPFLSFITDKGELIKVVTPTTGVVAELVAKPNEAVGEFPFPTNTLKELYGEVPLGTANIQSKKLKEEAFKSVTEPPGDKKFGTPAGAEIQSKIETIQKPIPKLDKELVSPKSKEK